MVFISCQKEFSTETGGLPGGGSTTGNNCKIQQLIETDITTSNAEYAYISTYIDKKVSKIELVDSTVNAVDHVFPITYPAGKVQVDASQFFIVGGNGRVTEFNGYEDPQDPSSDKFKVKYTYNSTGQLTRRTEETDSLPGVVIFQMDYTYAGSNLTKAEARVNVGTSLVKIGTINYEYDVSRTVKNFLFLHAIAPEILYFQTAINAGSNSTNPVKKTTSTYLNVVTGGDTTFISNFVNYTIDANNYVRSFEITGADFDEANLYAGKRYKLNYSCF